MGCLWGSERSDFSDLTDTCLALLMSGTSREKEYGRKKVHAGARLASFLLLR